MRIALVISSLDRGGAERVMSVLANAWTEKGEDVTIMTFDHGETTAYPLHGSVKRHSLGMSAVSSGYFQGLFRNLKRIAALRRAIRKSRPGVVISFMDSVNVLALLATRGLNLPVIVAERIDPSFYDIGRVWSRLRVWTYPFADMLVCQTSSALSRFQARIKVKGCVIPNPVTIPPEFMSRRNGDSNGMKPHVVIAMGRLVRQKGFDILLQAFSQVANRHPQWSLVIIGKGPLKTELEEQARALRMADRVRFTGEVPDPFAALRAADLFVLSSRFEGFPNVLCEAMACGLPVVSFDCPSGPADIIRQGVDGILVSPEDVSGLANAMDRLMGNVAERQRLAAHAPEVLDRFSIEKTLRLWQQLLDELLAARGSTGPMTSIRSIHRHSAGIDAP